MATQMTTSDLYPNEYKIEYKIISLGWGPRTHMSDGLAEMLEHLNKGLRDPFVVCCMTSDREGLHFLLHSHQYRSATWVTAS